MKPQIQKKKKKKKKRMLELRVELLIPTFFKEMLLMRGQTFLREKIMGSLF